MPDAAAQKRLTKVLKLKIIKPVDGSWDTLGALLSDVRYRVYRLANLAISEHYLCFHRRRIDPKDASRPATIGKLNARLHELLTQEAALSPKGAAKKDARPYAPYGKNLALPDTVAGALAQYKLRALTGKKWADVMRGHAALPSFRLEMAIPVRCDKPTHRRLVRNPATGDLELELMVCRKPYPKVVIGDRKIGDRAKAVLERLLENKSNSEDGYRQRVFEIKQQVSTNEWFLYVTYDFPADPPVRLDPAKVVGVDIGFHCPLYAAIGHGHARLGWRAFASLAARVRALRGRVIARRRDIQRGGAVAISGELARSGHGRRRKLLATEKLEGRIDDAYTTLNHQISAAVVRFALDNGAGLIQMENLEGLKNELSGTFLGQAWRYHQLQTFIEKKAAEKGVEVRRVNPRYTSRRCSECGFIHSAFTREFRDEHGRKGKAARFECPQCGFKADADYNAARNLAVLDIEEKIALELKSRDSLAEAGQSGVLW